MSTDHVAGTRLKPVCDTSNHWLGHQQQAHPGPKIITALRVVTVSVMYLAKIVFQN